MKPFDEIFEQELKRLSRDPVAYKLVKHKLRASPILYKFMRNLAATAAREGATAQKKAFASKTLNDSLHLKKYQVIQLNETAININWRVDKY